MNNNDIKIANAPCSWGALEFNLEAKAPDHLQVLGEIAETGYMGTELGDWGFMPTDPVQLGKIIREFDLSLIGAFVPVALADKDTHTQGVSHALRVAGLMFEAGYPEALVVLADDNGTVPERTLHAGRITPEMGLSDQGWATFSDGAMQVARAVRDKFGMRTVFHHHCAGYVETPAELDMLMKLTDPKLLGLCFDTGHYALGGGDPENAVKKYNNRIWHVHFKDYDPNIAQLSRAYQWNYFDLVKQGAFCELGKGAVNFGVVLGELNRMRYKGWAVVEQDVLPGMGTPKICARYNRVYLKQLGV